METILNQLEKFVEKQIGILKYFNESKIFSKDLNFKSIFRKFYQYEFCIDNEITKISFVLLERYLEKNYEYYNIQQMKVLYLVILCICFKYFDDNPYNNMSFSEVTGIPLLLLNELEIKILFSLDWKIMSTQI